MRTVLADPTSRLNNLNLLRLIAAFAVMVSHAWPIVHGPGTPEPLQATGYTLGTIAVMVFFGLSGFLIAASWLRDPNPGRFVRRRARRILPGLWGMLALCVFVLGPIASTLGAWEYLLAAQTWRFLFINATLMPVEPILPGVFDQNPYPAAAGSIWTLHYEALCYLSLAIVGLRGFLSENRFRFLIVGIVALSLLATWIGSDLHPRLVSLALLGLPFSLGVGAFVWRASLVLAWPGVVFLGLLVWVTRGTIAFPLLFAILVVYGTLWIGFVPSTVGRAFSGGWDISYGVYLYAFPIQGLVQHLAAPGDVTTHLALAIIPVMVLATLSWILIERPWLSGTLRPENRQPATTRSTRAPRVAPR